MAYSESYTCDVCGKQKAARESWWLAWVDCFQGQSSGTGPAADQADAMAAPVCAFGGSQASVRGAVRGYDDGPVDVGAA